MKKITAQFDVTYTQFLDEHGQALDTLPAMAQDKQSLTTLYQRMHLLRAFDAKAVNLQRTGKMGTYASTLGQEAIGVAIGYVMKPEDVYCPFYRDYGTLMQRDVPLSKILQYWGGDERGSDFNATSQDFPLCVPIASQCLHAAGIAYAFQYRQEKRVACVSIGDGGTSEGDFYEALNVAGCWKLPAVFVINNNQWAISVPRQIQSGCETLAQKAIAAGMPGFQVDGNDIVAMHEVLAQCFERARQGQGPALIEAITYRLCDHTTADDAKRYRDDSEVKNAWEKDPLTRLRLFLQKQHGWSEQDENNLLQRIQHDVEKIVAEYLNTPAPSPTDMFDHLYAEVPDALLEQYAEVANMTYEDHH